jgi:DNA-binding Lrp family transcriptional regulator
MDSLDVRIFRELWQGSVVPPLESDIRRSYRSMARKLGIDEVTFRNRVKKFQQSGLFKGWLLVVNPTLFDMRIGQLWLNVEAASAKDDLIKDLSLMPGVLAVMDCYGPSVTLVIMYESEIVLNRELELIARMSKDKKLIRVNIPVPKSAAVLTRTDWKIIKAIQTNPRQSYPLISRKVGISTKTVKRRLGKMIEEMALFVLPSIDPKALEGATIADLVVFYSNPESKADVDNKIVSQFDELLMRAELGDVEHGFFNLIIGNISKAKEILTWVRELPGVKSAFIELVQDRIEVYESFTDLVDRKLAEVSVLRRR